MKLLSFGEILWDVYPNEKYIGGAPLNFAAHFAGQGGVSAMLSAVGDDALGYSALEWLRGRGVGTEYVSVLHTAPTGQCTVTLDEHGIPHYELMNDTAYDRIEQPSLPDGAFDVFYFGTLALRGEGNRRVVSAMTDGNTFQEVFVDVNIRPPFVTDEAIALALGRATILKISDEELPFVTRLIFGTEDDCKTAAVKLAEVFANLRIIIITLGEKGAYAYDCRNGQDCFCAAERVEVVSTVGAGDGFSATFLRRYLSGCDIEDCLKAAVRIGAWVVSQPMAVPDYASIAD